MADYSQLIQSVKDQNPEDDITFAGPQSERSIQEIERVLSIRLPTSYVEFLRQYGGGGLPGNWISGIYYDDPFRQGVGYVIYDTQMARQNFDLPEQMIVVLHEHSTDALWCLNTSIYNGNDECPVVFFDVDTKKISAVSESFDDFFRLYLLSELDDNVYY